MAVKKSHFQGLVGLNGHIHMLAEEGLFGAGTL